MKAIAFLGIIFLLSCSPVFAQSNDKPVTVSETINRVEFQLRTVQLTEREANLTKSNRLGTLDDKNYREMQFALLMAQMEVFNDYVVRLPETNAIVKAWQLTLENLTNSMHEASVPDPDLYPKRSNPIQFGASEIVAKMKRDDSALCSAPDPSLNGRGTEVPGLREAMRTNPSLPRVLQQRELLASYKYVCGIARSVDVSGSQIIGSCFLLTNDYFATAYHVVKGKSDLHVFSGEWASGDIVPRYVFRIDSASYLVDTNKDICLFRTHPTMDSIFASQVIQSARCIKAGANTPSFSKLKIAGFPRQAIALLLTDNIFFIEHLLQWDSIRGDLLAMGPTWKGYSGAPLMMDDGCVIGIVRWQAFTNDTIDGIAFRFPPVKENSFGSVSIENALALLNLRRASKN